MTMHSSRRRGNVVLALVAACFLYLCLYVGLIPRNSASDGHNIGRRRAVPKKQQISLSSPPLTQDDDSVEMVVASTTRENINWLHDYLHQWKKNIYVVDDPNAALTVPKNKGREAMVFLTYIIDRYDSLPATVLFHHAERFQWHNDNPDYDALTLLQRLNVDYIRQQGYASLRCAWVLGCPVEIRPLADDGTPKPEEPISAKRIYKSAFEQMFADEAVPEKVGAPCCSQFGVSRDAIRSRSRLDYVRYRQWLLDTPASDDLSGRVLEYAWHIIFGKEPVHCPDAQTCYCRLYGLCDLTCRTPGSCDGQYSLPKYSTLPKGWPSVGWEKEDRGWSGPL